MRFFVIFLVILLTACSKPEAPPQLDVSEALGGDAAGYERAIEPRRFAFPSDHLSHPDFRNEWWYVTGNVTDSDGHPYGYQVTFFRSAISPEESARDSHWATRQLWMAHVALSDGKEKKHYFDERWVRGAMGLAGNQNRPFKVWVEDWQIEGGPDAEFPWRVNVETDDFTLDLSLMPAKPLVLQGDKGLSRKSAEPGNASYYYSYTRLATEGRIQLRYSDLIVQGDSWLDREWSTSALADDQAGWDWFSLQLDDGRELMYYQLRRKDGSTDPVSAGKLVLQNGETQNIRSEAVTATPTDWWHSPDGTRYPIQWRLSILGTGLDLRVRALFEAQEMRTTVHYWEGAIQVLDASTGSILGRGYLEMTGYGTAESH